MKCIYKYPLILTGHQELTLPNGAQVLSVAEQRGNIVIYALVDLNEEGPDQVVDVWVIGTGHEVPDELPRISRFLGTVNLSNGILMFHVFIREVTTSG